MTIAAGVHATGARPTRGLRQTAGLVSVLALLVAGCAADDADHVSAEPATAPAADIVELDPDETAALLEDQPDAVVIDVRSPEEVEELGALEGATFIDLQGGDFRERVAELDRDATYVLYCRTGNRSGQAAEIMRDLGFDDLHNAGGFDELQAAGLPTQP